MSTPEEKDPQAQFIKRPMPLFDDLSANRAHPYIWLLCEYVTRWTVNWYNTPEVMLSADEFMHGRRKPNSKERYDGGMPIDSRTSVLKYLKLAVEGGYLQERETWDSLERKAYSLPPWYHPDTCTLYEQVTPQREPKEAKDQKPVHPVNRSSPPNGQGVHRVYRGCPPDEQVATDQPASGAGRDVPIETPIQTFHKDKIETLPPVIKNEEEKKTKTEDPPHPFQPTAAPETAEQTRQRLEAEAARAARQLETRKRQEAIEAQQQARELERQAKQEEARKWREEQAAKEEASRPLQHRYDELVQAKGQAQPGSEEWQRVNEELKAVKAELAKLGWYL